MASIDFVAARTVIGGPDDVAPTNPTRVAKDTREETSAQIANGTPAERSIRAGASARGDIMIGTRVNFTV